MACFRLTLEYDGTDFEGWQRQPAGHRTVQGCLEEALRRLTGGHVAVVGAGRTDAGVHAEGQVASVRLPGPRGPEALARALNGILPADLVVVRAEPAPDGFDARRDARGKVYRYGIWNGAVRSPLRARRTHRVVAPLDLAAIETAAAALRGRHDFASFQAAGSGVRTTERTLRRLELGGAPGRLVEIEVEGDGFLRHMVRSVVGTLVEVGLGRRPAASLPGVLAARSRGAAGPTAPARGLTLVRVEYPDLPGMPGI